MLWSQLKQYRLLGSCRETGREKFAVKTRNFHLQLMKVFHLIYGDRNLLACVTNVTIKIIAVWWHLGVDKASIIDILNRTFIIRMYLLDTKPKRVRLIKAPTRQLRQPAVDSTFSWVINKWHYSLPRSPASHRSSLQIRQSLSGEMTHYGHGVKWWSTIDYELLMLSDKNLIRWWVVQSEPTV